MNWYLIINISHTLQPVYFDHVKGLSIICSGKFESGEEAVEFAARVNQMRPTDFSATLGRLIYENGRVKSVIYGSPKFYDLVYRGKYILTNQPKELVAAKREQCLKTGSYQEQFLKMIPRA